MGHQKCNTDGTSRGNPGRSSYGFYVRDHTGNLCYAQARISGHMTSIQAEAIATLEALRYWESERHATKTLKINSLVMLNIIKKNWRVPWKIIEIVEEIQ